jgi:hypothetical protein
LHIITQLKYRIVSERKYGNLVLYFKVLLIMALTNHLTIIALAQSRQPLSVDTAHLELLQ